MHINPYFIIPAHLTLSLISTRSVTYSTTENSNVRIDRNVLKMVECRAFIKLILYVFFQRSPRVMRLSLFMHLFYGEDGKNFQFSVLTPPSVNTERRVST